MKHPFVIAINSISGGGKTTLANALGKRLPSSQAFYFDDFDATNVYPADYVDWWKRGAYVEEFSSPGMDEAVRTCLKHGEVETVILDYPFGRLHRCFRDIINMSVYIDTPADVALCRRIIRDHLAGNIATDALRDALTSYLASSREVYLDSARRYRDEADLILDGCTDITTLTSQTINHIEAQRASQ